MDTPWTGLRTAVCMTIFSLSSLSSAPAAETALHPEFKGVWLGLGQAGDLRWVVTPYVPQPEFTEWGRQESVRLSVDKVGVCDLSNPVYFIGQGGVSPVQFLDGGNQIVILTETIVQPRRVYTDGRKHPDDPDPSWLGHSIGHWESDTLVIDTIGTNGRGRALNGLISNGPPGRPGLSSTAPRLPASEGLHVVERIRLLERGQVMEITTTVDDPKTYKQSFSFKRYLQRRPDIDLVEYQCIDN